MKTINRILLCALAFVASTANAADELTLTSPNGQMQMNFSLTEKGEPVYDLSYKGKAVINPSKLGLAVLRSLVSRRVPSMRRGSPSGGRPVISVITTTN